MKVLVSWYLEDTAKFAASTKELVMRGSLRWAEREEQDMAGVWWDLPDGLEGLFAISNSLPFPFSQAYRKVAIAISFSLKTLLLFLSFPYLLVDIRLIVSS